MNCAECEHLKIVNQPLRGMYGLYELGYAKCTKHNLITDFVDMRKFKKMTCPTESEGENETDSD